MYCSSILVCCIKHENVYTNSPYVGLYSARMSGYRYYYIVLYDYATGNISSLLHVIRHLDIRNVFCADLANI